MICIQLLKNKTMGIIAFEATGLSLDGNEMGKVDSFKTCPACGHSWENRDAFIEDENVSIVGYQARFESLKAGIFMFNHSCRGTLALDVDSFADLYDGPIFTKRFTGSDDCPEYCQHKSNLLPCPTECECAFVREIIQRLKNKKAF